MKKVINKIINIFGIFAVNICFIFFLSAHVSAETKITLQNSNFERITDLANIFTEKQEKQLQQLIFTIEEKTKAQIAILTVQTLHEKNLNQEELDIFQFGIELLSNKNLGWNIGDEKLDTGLFLIIAKNDRKYRFFTGYGLEGVLPDLRIKQIAESNFPTHFKKQDYFTGVYLALSDIKLFLENDEEITKKYGKPISEEFSKIAIFLLIAFSFFAGLFVSNIKNANVKKKFFFGISTGIFLTILTPYIFFDIVVFSLFLFAFTSGEKNNSGGFHSGNWSSGGGFGRSSGFSSFGGGSFGGGGFGGNW